MSNEKPYTPFPITARAADGSESSAESPPPMPDLSFARPMGAWVIVGALFVVVIALWALVAFYFSTRA